MDRYFLDMLWSGGLRKSMRDVRDPKTSTMGRVRPPAKVREESTRLAASNSSRAMVSPPKSSGWGTNSRTYFVETPSRTEEHTSEIQSLMRRSYDGCCLKRKTRPHALCHGDYRTILIS